MILSQDDHKQIQGWLDSDRNYIVGVQLYITFGRNKTLKNLFPNREHRYGSKLSYELSKLIGKPEFKANPIVVKAPIASDVIPVPGDITIEKDSIPKIIARIILAIRENYQKRSKLHQKLKKLPPDDRSVNVVHRRGLVQGMSKLSERVDFLTNTRKKWEKTKVLPDPEVVFKKEKTDKAPVVDITTAKKLRLNLLKNLASDRNLLKYQSKKKLADPCPMPEGPNKTKVLSRIKEKEAKVKTYDKIIDNGTSKDI